MVSKPFVFLNNHSSHIQLVLLAAAVPSHRSSRLAGCVLSVRVLPACPAMLFMLATSTMAVEGLAASRYVNVLMAVSDHCFVHCVSGFDGIRTR